MGRKRKNEAATPLGEQIGDQNLLLSTPIHAENTDLVTASLTQSMMSNQALPPSLFPPSASSSIALISEEDPQVCNPYLSMHLYDRCLTARLSHDYSYTPYRSLVIIV